MCLKCAQDIHKKNRLILREFRDPPPSFIPLKKSDKKDFKERLLKRLDEDPEFRERVAEMLEK